MSKVVHFKENDSDVKCIFRLKPKKFLAVTNNKKLITCKRCLAKLKKEKSK